MNPEDEGNTTAGNATISYNQRSNLKMEADEALGTGATISSVLYANINHPEWKTEYPGETLFLLDIFNAFLFYFFIRIVILIRIF